MREIPLTRGYVALVDDCDYERVSQFHWQAAPHGRTVYATRAICKVDGTKTTQKLHRFILGLTDPKIHVDHRDHDGLNNTRDNLRIATSSQNRANARKPSGTTSVFRGVYWRKQARSWHARIRINGKTRHLGYFANEVDAAKAYDCAAIKYHGEFANLNFPPKKPASNAAPNTLAVTA